MSRFEVSSDTPLWSPSAESCERAEITRFMRWAQPRAGREIDSYERLWQWSVDDLEAFWASIWDFYGVHCSAPYERVLADRSMPGAQWFTGAKLNFAENLLTDLTPALDDGRLGRQRDPGAVAVMHCSELREELGELTWAELRQQVAEAAGGLRALGVGRGDVVAAYMPNIPETVIALLATASIGAIWSSAAPEFGARAVIDRFAQIEPKVLLAVDGYRHGGNDHDRRHMVERVRSELPQLQHTVLLGYLDENAKLDGAISWQALLEHGCGSELSFEQVEFDHPLWVLYSSGTTGLPKGIVHGHGGILLELLKQRLHMDLRPGERMFSFTTTGWMMWNFLVGCLLSPATIVLYDGSPIEPDAGVLWRLAERAKLACMGLSAGLLTTCEKAGIEPGREFDLSALRAIGSTGSPLWPSGFKWVYEHVGAHVWLYSTSGGTDVCTPFVGGCPILPVYEGELQCRMTGCSVESWDEQGHPHVGGVGELVITEPMPSMPLYLWGDDDGERLRQSYFDVYPGVWRHGDWIQITPRGGAVIYGRSDSTINRQGVRMGTSEIYRAASSVPDVLDALVVDVPHPDDDRESLMMLFVVLSPGVSLDDTLERDIKRRIRDDCSPRHVPNVVKQIAEVPRTLSGKVLEVPVKRILTGQPVGQSASRDSLANPDSLDYFVELAAELGTRATDAADPSARCASGAGADDHDGAAV